MDIYREMLGKMYQQYLYHSGKKEYQTLHDVFKPAQSYISSIDDVLAQDSREVFDKIKHTALNVAYRIKIHNDISYILSYNWYTARREFLAMSQLYPVRDHGSERRRSMLTSDLFKIYKNMMDEELQCWKDLQEPMMYFIHLFHHYKRLGQDRKMIEAQ